MIRPFAALLVLAWASQACAGPKPAPGFTAVLPPAAAPARVADGAIFNATDGYAALTQGHRARKVGDPLTIVLVERTTSTKAAGSKTDRGGAIGVTPPTGLLSIFSGAGLNASGDSSFKGDGNASQSNALSGEVTVTIVEVRSNGTALVRGEKHLMLSQGKEWIQLSGIIRLADIDADNRVASTRVADARIEYSGNGPVSRASREGWLSKFFGAISPF